MSVKIANETGIGVECLGFMVDQRMNPKSKDLLEESVVHFMAIGGGEAMKPFMANVKGGKPLTVSGNNKQESIDFRVMRSQEWVYQEHNRHSGRSYRQEVYLTSAFDSINSRLNDETVSFVCGLGESRCEDVRGSIDVLDWENVLRHLDKLGMYDLSKRSGESYISNIDSIIHENQVTALAPLIILWGGEILKRAKCPIPRDLRFVSQLFFSLIAVFAETKKDGIVFPHVYKSPKVRTMAKDLIWNNEIRKQDWLSSRGKGGKEKTNFYVCGYANKWSGGVVSTRISQKKLVKIVLSEYKAFQKLA